MSSESSLSSGSRIREFGLYRTIDARTEEFLRLSRRRQIRQGCACAAVSTAITVTVVVVVFIVYEFSLNSEINLDNSLKSNWFNLMNVTSDGHFESSLKKNVDPTTLQLLPMLIKALKKNVILEKVLEEHSSSSPLIDKKHNTDDDYYNNQDFTRNWFKWPTSKLYTIEYKSSPVVYFRSPTKSIELFTKIRKVRDYQRILKYIDKMINEKVYLGSTKPVIKEEVYTFTQRPLVKSKLKHLKSSNSKKVYRKTVSDLPANYNLRNEDKNDGSCKCPKNISMLLMKFLNSIQKVRPLPTTKITLDNDIILGKPTVLESNNITKGKNNNDRIIRKLTGLESNNLNEGKDNNDRILGKPTVLESNNLYEGKDNNDRIIRKLTVLESNNLNEGKDNNDRILGKPTVLETNYMNEGKYNNDRILGKPTVLESNNMNKGITAVSDIVHKITTKEIEKQHEKNIIRPIRTELIQPNSNEEATQSSLYHTTTEDEYLAYNLPLNSIDDKGKKEQYIKSTTVNNVVEGTYIEDILYPTTTKPIKSKNTKMKQKLAPGSTKFVFDKYSVESYKTIERPKKLVGLFINDTEYDDEFYSTTPKDSESDFTNKLPLIKSKTVPDKRFRNKRKKKSKKFLELTNYDDDESLKFLRRLNVDLYNLIELNARLLGLEKTTSEAPSFANKQTKTQPINSLSRESVRHSLNTTLTSESFEMENADEFDVKELPSLHDMNLTTVTEKPDISWENVNVEPVSTFKSMIPVDRPVYLEFHRNDWKQGGPNDFDYVTNNIYDNMPNL